MLLFLRIILAISFCGVAGVIIKEKMRHPANRRGFMDDIARLFRVFKFFGQRRHPKSDVGSSFRQGPNIFTARIAPKAKLLFRRAALKGEALLSFLFPRLRKMPARLRKGAGLFVKDMRRVLRALGKFIFRKGAGLVETVRQDLKTFELPKHKEDFFDRLQQEDVREQRRPLGETLRRYKARDEAAPAVKSLAPSHVPQESLAGFQSEEVRIDYEAQKTSDQELFHEKEEQLLEQIMKNPKNPNSYKKLGKIYLLLENLPDARQCFEHAIKLGARDPELHQLLTQTQKGA